MEILVSVGVKVMAPVMGRPPEWPLLIRCGSSESEQKLKNPAGSVSAVREEAMKAGGNRKHAHHVQRETSNHRHPTHACPDDQQAGQVHEQELRADEVVEFIVIERGICID